MVSFLGGLVYTTRHKLWSADQQQPLLVLRDLKTGPRLVELFKDKRVCGLAVDGNTLYVLTERWLGGKWAAEVYSTTDLQNWTRRADFQAEAMPNAMAVLGGSIYVGLANRGYDAATYNAHGEEKYTFADQAAGDILRLEAGTAAIHER
jgi:hypothetical protein